MNLFYIYGNETLDKIIEILKLAYTNKIIAVDIEAENNFHHYGYYISLIQLAVDDDVFIVDALQLNYDNIKPILNIFINSEIEKVFHDINFDFRILNYQYSIIPNNFFDTKIAAEVLKEERVGLNYLLDKYFDVKKNKRYQKSDWSKRPLTYDQLLYAANDVKFLISLRNILLRNLQEKGLLNEYEERINQIKNKEFKLKIPDYKDVKGVSNLNGEELSLFKDLFVLRDKLARRINRPPFYIISNKKLLEIVKNPPKTLKEWRTLKGVHPLLRRKAELFYAIVIKHKNNHRT